MTAILDRKQDVHTMKIVTHRNPKPQPITWDTSAPETVAAAKTAFKQAVVDDKMMAYRTDEKGASEQVRDFDPEAREITVTAPLAGG